MGEMEVPADALYGASTQRAVLNFPISGERMPRRFLRALALIKLAAAQTNAELGLLDAGRRGRDRRGCGSGRRWRPRRAVPDRHLPDRLGDLDQHEHERGRRHTWPRAAWARAERSTPTTRSTAARARTTSSRRRSSCRPRWPSRRTCCPPSSASTPRWWPRSRRSGRSSRPAGPTSRTRHRSGSARSSAATPARSRSRSGAHARPRPSCSRSRSAGPRSGPGSTPIPNTPSGRAPGCPA